jgi:peptidoglycan hydrolase-like protein with peptidoglycan-binding domain
MKRRILAGIIGAVLMIGLLIPNALAENLRYGSSGSQVNQAQARLAELGYYKGEIDGKFGYTTYMAVRAFQDKNGLKVDGVIGEVTNYVLFSPGAIKATGEASSAALYQRIAYGDSGPAVKTVQGLLRDQGYYTKDVEGKFGFSTYQAVLKYQKDMGLKVDGVVGPITWAALTGALPPPPPPRPPLPFDPLSKLPYRYNDKNPGVLMIQQKLDALGYNVGALDGRFGYQTYLAVRAFQKNNSLSVDGIVGVDTWNTLFGPHPVPASGSPPSSGVLRIQHGDSGDKVGQIQTKLQSLGYLAGGAVDKKFGYDTYDAVKAFQKKNGLPVDGIVGQKTWDKLFGGSAIPADAPPPPVVEKLPLKYKGSGNMVKQLQTKLVALGYLTVKYTESYFDFQTYEAVRSFQHHNKLKVDGVVGQKTWDAINHPGAIPKP